MGEVTAIRGRRVITAEGERAATVLLRDGTIAGLAGYPDAPDGALTLAGDEVLLPGLVDSHVHVNEPGRTEWEGFGTATAAAAAGGVTTIVDMPLNSIPPTVTVPALRAKQAAAVGQLAVDVAFWGGAVPGNVADLRPLHEAGVVGFKCFLLPSGVDEFAPLDAGQLASAMTEIASFGGLLIAHAEDPGVIAAAPAARGRRYADFLASRPPEAEQRAIGALLELTRRTGCRTHVVHLASATALPAVRAAKAAGLPVSAETCPHYLLLDESELVARGGEAKINPPLRAAPLPSDGLDLISSDHVGWPVQRKRGPDIFALASGAPGVELIVPLVHDALGARELVRLVSEAPARRFGLWPRKGNLMPGADADVLVLDPELEWEVDPAKLVTAAGWSPYSGRRLRGRVIAAFSRGVQVWNGERAGAAAGHGRFVAANTARETQRA